jgi:hypothetical protein
MRTVWGSNEVQSPLTRAAESSFSESWPVPGGFLQLVHVSPQTTTCSGQWAYHLCPQPGRGAGESGRCRQTLPGWEAVGKSATAVRGARLAEDRRRAEGRRLRSDGQGSVGRGCQSQDDGGLGGVEAGQACPRTWARIGPCWSYRPSAVAKVRRDSDAQGNVKLLTASGSANLCGVAGQLFSPGRYLWHGASGGGGARLTLAARLDCRVYCTPWCRQGFLGRVFCSFGWQKQRTAKSDVRGSSQGGEGTILNVSGVRLTNPMHGRQAMDAASTTRPRTSAKRQG